MSDLNFLKQLLFFLTWFISFFFNVEGLFKGVNMNVLRVYI
jgi:hypothetical protein